MITQRVGSSLELIPHLFGAYVVTITVLNVPLLELHRAVMDVAERAQEWLDLDSPIAKRHDSRRDLKKLTREQRLERHRRMKAEMAKDAEAAWRAGKHQPS